MESAQDRLSLHLSKCQIVGTLMPCHEGVAGGDFRNSVVKEKALICLTFNAKDAIRKTCKRVNVI